MNVLLELSQNALSALAEAIESERIKPPYSAMSVKRFAATTKSTEVAEGLNAFVGAGASSKALSEMLRLLAEEKKRQRDVREEVGLVWTGPEETGTASRDTGVVVEELFTHAEHSVWIAGFAIHKGHQVFQTLARRMDDVPDLRVRMFLNVARAQYDTTRDEDVLAAFRENFRDKEWPGERLPEIFYDPRSLSTDWRKRASLHGKCIVVDLRRSFVTSANFTEAAQERNIEVGVVIESEAFATALVTQFEGLVRSGKLVRLG